MKGYALEDKPLTSQQNWKYLFLKLIVNKTFQRLYHV